MSKFELEVRRSFMLWKPRARVARGKSAPAEEAEKPAPDEEVPAAPTEEAE